MAAVLGLEFYIAQLYHSCERVLRKHLHGLARQRRPKWQGFK